MINKKTAVYARVSTQDQSTEAQINALREYAEKRGLSIQYELIDEGVSGAKESRPALNKLMDLARKRKIDVVLVYRFDRFARSVKQLIMALEEFEKLNINFISYNENIDTTSAAGKVMFTMVAAFSAFERAILSERVKNALINAKKKGRKLGRPSIPETVKNEIMLLRSSGKSMDDISEKLQISKGVVHKTLQNQSL